MKKFAVIDIGSNSVRLMFVADGKVLYKDLRSTRIGEGLALSGTLKTEAIERSAQAVKEFYDKAKSEGAEEVGAFATAAVRSAKNGQAFVERVKQLCPVNLEVISGELEAELGVLGALGEADGALIDIGGASSELVVKKQGAIIYKTSANIGVVRIKDAGENAQTLMQNALAEYKNPPLNEVLYAIGGTATTLASLYLRLEKYNSNLVTGTEITANELKGMIDYLKSLSVAEIAKLPCMPAGRADIIVGGAVWLYTLIKRFEIEKIIVSDRDNLEGYAIKKGWL